MYSEQIIIDKPINFPASIKNEVCELVAEGGQIKYNDAKVGVHRAELLAVYKQNDKVIASACLKNPNTRYRDRVFSSAEVPEKKDGYKFELGYIATCKGFEGQKICQKLLLELFPKISHFPMFATSRKPEMAHILNKFKFEKCGLKYKDDLELFLYK